MKCERGVADILYRAWDIRLEKIAEDRLYLADFAAIKDGTVRAFIEIRVRSCKSKQYPHLFFPLHKLQWARSMYDAVGLPYFYVVQFTGDGVTSYTPIHTLHSPRLSWVRRVTERETHPDGPVVELDASSLRVIARRKVSELA